MSAIVSVLIYKRKYFTLDELNSFIKSFPFNDNANKPPEISRNRSNNQALLKMSASEMLSFVRFFGLMVGHLITDKEDEYWKLYKYLRQIIDILCSPRIIDSDAKQLKVLIKLHHELYIRLCGPLKPKFHILSHYPRILFENGPFTNFWCMRFESRHRDLKANWVF